MSSLPTHYDELNYLLDKLKYIGTDDGYNMSNDYDYIPVYNYPKDL